MADYTGRLYAPPALVRGGFTGDFVGRMLLVSGPGSGGSGGTAPVVTFTPLDGTPIARTDSLVAEVTDVENDITLICLSARFVGIGTEEVIWRQGRFADLYAASVETPIANGTRFTISRAGGWPDSPTLQVDSVDAAGNLV